MEHFFAKVKNNSFVNFLKLRRIDFKCKPKSKTKVKMLKVESRNISHEDFFGDSLKFLKWISIDLTPKSNNTKSNEKRQRMLSYIVPWIHLLNLFAYLLSLIYHAWQNYSDTFCVNYSIMICIATAILTSKMAILTQMQQELTLFIDRLNDFYPKRKSINDESKKFLLNHKLLRRVIIVASIFTLVILALIPLIIFCVNRDIVMPMFFARSIFDPTKNALLYFLVYVWQLVFSIESIIIHFACDLVIFTMIMLLSLEWIILARDFCKLFSSKYKNFI